LEAVCLEKIKSRHESIQIKIYVFRTGPEFFPDPSGILILTGKKKRGFCLPQCQSQSTIIKHQLQHHEWREIYCKWPCQHQKF